MADNYIVKLATLMGREQKIRRVATLGSIDIKDESFELVKRIKLAARIQKKEYIAMQSEAFYCRVTAI